MSTVRISRKAASATYDLLSGADMVGHLNQSEIRALEELRRALAPKRSKPLKVARLKAKAAKKESAFQRWSRIRAEVFERAGHFCECGCGVPFGGFQGSKQPDHFMGKARSESVDTVWALRAGCHDAKTLNHPSASYWLRKFIAHAERHCYWGAANKARERLVSEEMVEEAAKLTGVSP